MLLDSSVYNDFLQLVRLGIGHQAGPLSVNPDWEAIYAQALKHALPAVLVDGINDVRCMMEEVRCEGDSHTSAIKHHPSAIIPPKELMLQWIGKVLQGFEMPRKRYLKAVASLAGFYNAHGYKMMVLKGYACSLNFYRISRLITISKILTSFSKIIAKREKDSSIPENSCIFVPQKLSNEKEHQYVRRQYHSVQFAQR